MAGKKVKVSRSEFAEAISNGYIDGEITEYYEVNGRLQQGTLYVYVELGREREYIPKANENLKTERRCFVNCTICYAISEQDRDEGNFETELPHQTVIIYC
jgi:hypothetical protein